MGKGTGTIWHVETLPSWHVATSLTQFVTPWIVFYVIWWASSCYRCKLTPWGIQRLTHIPGWALLNRENLFPPRSASYTDLWPFLNIWMRPSSENSFLFILSKILSQKEQIFRTVFLHAEKKQKVVMMPGLYEALKQLLNWCKRWSHTNSNLAWWCFIVKWFQQHVRI